MLPDSTVQRLRQFACPQEPFDDNAMTRIWDTLIQSTLRAFLDQWHDADPNHRDLANYVAQAPQARPVFEETWDIAYGRIAQGSWDDPHVALDLAAGLAMRRAAAGQPGAWSATFGALRRFRWGHILLPPVDSISVESDGTFATIRTGGGKLRLECRGGEWSGPGAEALPRFGPGKSVMLVPKYAVEELEVVDDFNTIRGYPSPDAAMTGSFGAAIDALMSHAPAYGIWVRRLLRGVLVCEAVRSRTRSSSWKEAPGLVLMSHTDDLSLIAEMLVHECSHQYFYLLNWLGPFDDETDHELYYSPAVGRARPLNKILIAYHAFANVLLMYQDFRADGFDVTGCDRVIGRLTHDVEALDRPLRNNPSLGATGKALYLPLADRLLSAGLVCPDT